MKPKNFLAALSTLLLLSPVAVQAHEPADKLGKVTFPTSCDAKVQAEFESGVAMLHSYWFNYAGKTFRSVLQKDPNCVMAYWGIALDFLGNSLSAPPQPKDSQAAWEALEPGGKAATPDLIAHAIAFVAAPSTQFVTGQTLFVDGGKSLGGLGI